MKKTLFFVLAVAFCFSLTAQRQLPEKLNIASEKAYFKAPTYDGSNDANFIPSQRQSDYAPKSIHTDYVIGTTNYTTVTNANARNTVNWSPDGKTCAAVWTHGEYNTKRGTAINYFNSTTEEWGEPVEATPYSRIEDGPLANTWMPGWGTHAFTEEGECVVSHCTGAHGIVVNCREKAGEGEWIQTVLKGPVQSDGNTDIQWPSIIAVGNTIHMVCVTAQGTTANPVTYLGYSTYPLYYRSTDGGKTWDDMVLLNMMPKKDIKGIGGDSYVITAREKHIVIAYVAHKAAYLESTDGGDTWERKLAYDCTLDFDTTGVFFYPAMVPYTIGAAIGDDDVVHIAFSTRLWMRDEANEINYGTNWPMLCAMFAWNSTRPTLTEADFGIEYDKTAGELTQIDYDLVPGFLDAPDLLGFGFFAYKSRNEWGGYLKDNYRRLGYITNPRLVAENNRVYLMYTAVLQPPLISPTNEFFRGVFVTVSEDNGATFDQENNTSWISYHDGLESLLFLCDWESYEGPNLDSTDMIGAPNVTSACENVYPTMSSSIGNGLLAFTWINDIFPLLAGDNVDPWVTNTVNVMGITVSAKDLGTTYFKTNEIWRGEGTKVDEKETINNLKIYPNPAGNNTVIEVGTTNPYTLTVTNIMGQVVHTEKGQQSQVNLNVANYPAGVYIVNVKTAHASASQKLIVK